MAILVNSSTDVLSSTAGLPSTSAVTMLGWFWFTDDPNTNVGNLFRIDGPSTDFGALFYDYYWNELAVAYQTNGTLWTYTGFAFVPGVQTWFAAAWTCDDNTHYAYYGTDPSNLSSWTAGISSSSVAFTGDELQIATHATADNYLRGRAAGVKIYDAVLTQAEVAAELCRMTPVRTANLNRCHPFIGGTIAEAVRDIGPGGYDLSATSIDIADGPPVSWGGSIILPQYATSTAPALSSPGVQSITATTAVPKVTLTFA